MTERYINEPKVEERSEQPYAAISIQASLSEWSKVNKLVDEIFEWLASREIEPAGPLFYRYWIIGDSNEPFQLEVGLPLEQMAPGDERVITGFLPGGSYVTALHHGHPDKLEQSFNELEIWAKKEGLLLDKQWDGDKEVWNGRFETYLTNFAVEPDLANWKIGISYLLLRDDAA